MTKPTATGAATATGATTTTTTTRPYGNEYYDKFAKILDPHVFTTFSRSRPNSSEVKYRHRATNEIEGDVNRIAKMILDYGIPINESRPSLRPVVWKIMLNVEHLKPQDYLRYVALGPSTVSTKIRNDTFRTLATDTQFKGKVKEDMLIRMLDAFVHKNEAADREGLPFSYVQGMNVLAAPFLYTMPSQVEAFACFSKFIETKCPLYVQPTLAGVHAGLKLLDRCLQYVDEELYDYLRSKNLSAEIYAFAPVMTFCACTPPLDEVLKLWDFLLAFGVHLNILCVAAQVHLFRDTLLQSPSPMKLLRSFPPLDAKSVISTTTLMARGIPEDLYEDLVAHLSLA